jgi:N-acetylmuramic acid 6-phosphate etherase
MTEKFNPKFLDFDLWPTEDAIMAMYNSQIEAVSAIKTAIPNITEAAVAAALRLGTTGRLVYCGAGTSGRLAVQDGAELTPTFGWPKDRLIYCMAGGINALTNSIEGAEDKEADGAKLIEGAGIGQNDVFFGVAASGKTPFTLGALKQANKQGGLTIGISNNPNTPILEEANFGILIETGSEVIAGSTRMKAGTAQKIVLNMLSTAMMSKLGRIYNGLMVDMIVSNKKLENRAIYMVASITNCSIDEASKALAQANKNIKLATLLALGETPEFALRILRKTQGNLREALAIVCH